MVLQESLDIKGSGFLHVLPDSVLRQYTWSWNSTIVYDLIDRAPRSTNRYQWNLIIRTAAPTFIAQFYREHFIARHNDYFAFWNSLSKIYVKITAHYSNADLEPLSLGHRWPNLSSRPTTSSRGWLNAASNLRRYVDLMTRVWWHLRV